MGIKNTLNQNNAAFAETVNNINQQTVITQNQMIGLQRELQQMQQRQQSPERNLIGQNIINSGYPTYNSSNPTDNGGSNTQITEALRLLGTGTYNGDANEWFEYKLRIENIIEAL